MDGGGSFSVVASNRSAIGVADEGDAIDTSGTPSVAAAVVAAALDRMDLRAMRWFAGS